MHIQILDITTPINEFISHSAIFNNNLKKVCKCFKSLSLIYYNVTGFFTVIEYKTTTIQWLPYYGRVGPFFSVSTRTRRMNKSPTNKCS